jgi:hypothetical protein
LGWRQDTTDPFKLLSLVRVVGHTFSYTIWVPKSPDSKLMQDAYLLEYVEIAKLLRFLLFAVWVQVRCFGLVLASSILVPNVVARAVSERGDRTRVKDLLETSMGGDPLEQGETDLLEFFGVAWLQAFGLKVLYTSN